MTPFVAVDVGGEVFFVSTNDDGPGRALFIGRWRTDISALRRAAGWLATHRVALPPDPVFVDAGANIGTTTVMALRRHDFAEAVALEPSPGNYEALLLNLVANRLESRVVALPTAASDRDGPLVLEIGKRNRGGHRVARTADRAEHTIMVEGVTLDGLVSRGVIDPARVGLLWVDTPRHEGAVLAGASTLLEASVPVVVAIRPVSGSGAPRPWDVAPETRRAVMERLTAHYTHAVELRDKSGEGLRAFGVDALDALVDSYGHCQDLLLVRA